MRYLLILSMLSVFALNANCLKCERIRAENALKAKEQDWVFYEDWLEKHGDEAESDVSVAPEENKKDK